MVFFIGIAAGAATLLGGLIALKFKDNLHLMLGFSAGAVVALAFFDLIPEAIELAGTAEPHDTMTIVAIGFLAYLLVDRLLTLFGGHAHNPQDQHDHKGHMGAASFVAHSFLDGLAIGFAFQVSAALGIVVAIAVLVHDLSDGINTVSAALRAGGSTKKAFGWLAVGSVAPILGIALSSVITLSEESLAPVLALFAGFFLYLGASELIPESHHRHPRLLTTLMTLLGALVLYVAISIAHS